MEMDQLTLKAKEEALEASRQMEKLEMERKLKEAKDKEEYAKKQNEMALKLQVCRTICYEFKCYWRK